MFRSLLACLALIATANVSSAATIELVNADAADTGFNDPAPVDPVGGNEGTTLGEQRWNAVTRAAEVWEDAIPGSIPVRVEVWFAPSPAVPCGVLAQTAVTAYGAARGTLYPIALANELGGQDLLDAGDVH